jgi:rod shape-determining protein MreC
MTTLSTRQTFALVALFVATSLAFIQLDNRRALDPIKDGLYAVVAPAVDAFDRVGGGGPAGDTPLERELAAVKAERDQLAADNARLRDEVREVDQLRMQAQLKKDHPSWEMLSAHVRSPDPSNFQKFLIVNKGSADGVNEGMAVVAQGLNYVGQVTEVAEHSAQVMLMSSAAKRFMGHLHKERTVAGRRPSGRPTTRPSGTP